MKPLFIPSLVLVSLLAACQSPPAPAAPGSGSGAATEASSAAAPGSGSGAGAVAEASTAPADPLAAPADVAAPPADAERTASGLASRVLQPGTGTAHPDENDEVSVHYTGWTTDGERFDSSVERGQPASFPLNGVIAGWTEGLQLMVVGEKRRFWIPVDLAYRGQPGRPAGMLVFDVELLAITEVADPPPAPADVAAAPATATTTASGLAYTVLQPGAGAMPTENDVVLVQYTVWNPEGRMLHTTTSQAEPERVPLSEMPGPGWSEALRGMMAGEKRRLWLTNALAFGGRPGAPEGPITVDIELVSFEAPPAAPTVPADVAAIPSDATVTATGLASRVLTPGTGTTHPTAASTVEVHYSGWTTDGQMFDSSVTRGEPIQFPLSGVIAGWTEGVQLMVEGETRRLWIPENLAYQGQPGAPAGMLVFDVQLLRIVN